MEFAEFADMRPGYIRSLILVLAFASVTTAQDGRLATLREDLNRSPSAPAGVPASDNNGSFLSGFLNGLFSSDDGCPGVGSPAIGATALAPFYIPAFLLGDEYDHRLFFLPHPYAYQFPIYQIADRDLARELYQNDTDQAPRNIWAFRLSLENGNDFAGLNRVNGQIKIEHANRWGVNSNWNWFIERMPCGCLDETVVSDTNLTYRFAQHEMGSLYTGLGLRLLTDRQQTDFGVNFTYGGDWFPVRPLVVSGVFDAGTLGNAGVVHTRATAGAIWQGWEVFAGYDFLRIGHVNLQGPMVGVRWWF